MKKTNAKPILVKDPPKGSRVEAIENILQKALKRSPKSQEGFAAYLRSAGFYEAAMVLSSAKTGNACMASGYWAEGMDGITRCDSGNYEPGETGLRCSHCRLRAA